MKVLHHVRMDSVERTVFRDRIMPIATLAYIDAEYDADDRRDPIARRYRALHALVDLNPLSPEQLAGIKQLLDDLRAKVVEQADADWWMGVGAVIPFLIEPGKERDVADGLAATRRAQLTGVDEALEIIKQAQALAPAWPVPDKLVGV